MGTDLKDPLPGSSSVVVFKLPGEPAIVINGVPDVSSCDNTLALSNSTSDVVLLHGDLGFGEWLEGRKVQKLFGNQCYSGTITEFDKETGWYRVVYEDGDFEDLEWHELEEVLSPLDITVPLKSLALKTLRRDMKVVHKSGKTIARSGNHKVKKVGNKGKPKCTG